MPERLKPPFHADHVGSLIRPDNLLKARVAAENGEMTPQELLDIQHDAIRGVVRMQEDIGLKLVTDGEYNRFSWQRDFLLKIGNVENMRIAADRALPFRSGHARSYAAVLTCCGQAVPAVRYFCR